MAIEFDIKAARLVSCEALERRIAALMRTFGVDDELQVDEGLDVQWGDEERVTVVKIGDTIASVEIHKAGEEVDMGEEGGFWISVSAARSRTGAGVFFTAVVAIAIANETGSTLIDESSLLGLGRSLRSDEALAQLGRMAGDGPLQDIGRRLATRFGLTSSM